MSHLSEHIYCQEKPDLFEHVRQIGPMLRDDLVATVPREGTYLLSYLRMA